MITHRRFPRSKYMRAVRRMQDEMGEWRTHYRLVAQEADSRYLSDLLVERSIQVDELWHLLDQVGDAFQFMQLARKP